MNGEAVKAIVENSRKPQTLTLPGGRTALLMPSNSGSGFEWVQPEQTLPEPQPITLHTLSGLVEYLRVQLDKLDQAAIAIHVVGHDRVELITQLQGSFLQRIKYITCTAQPPSFAWGHFHDVETFVVALQSLFVDAGDRAQVLAVVGNIKEETVKQTQDDGTTQTVIGRAGIAKVAEIPVPNPVRLAPFRTFVEVEQPVSSFVLRMQSGPRVALFEADGGRWKLEAIARIVAYLKAANLGVSIIA